MAGLCEGGNESPGSLKAISEIGTDGGLCESGNEPPSSLKAISKWKEIDAPEFKRCNVFAKLRRPQLREKKSKKSLQHALDVYVMELAASDN
ncbi:hypothetical protein ANN_14511 [Periplaneta americana]|uniref:Uncharacterized protein n=1 Tax=Periplaneta americana TaxID=6978 RepID=A0ABQ8SWI9_PERAM|nr:hypothetical protein ANN_14511 [Periplaneta americana]